MDLRAQFDAYHRKLQRDMEAIARRLIDERLSIIRGGKIPAQLISGDVGMTNPMTAAGDIIVGGVDGAAARLAKGDDGQVLQVASGAIGWGTASGGGGGTIHTSAYASPPASPASGDLWLPTDGIAEYRYSGSAWVPWGPVFPLTTPVDGDFAWVNQGGASIIAVKGMIYLSIPASATQQYRIRKKAAPATPYSITAMLIPDQPYSAVQGWALIWRQSSDGKLITFGCQIQANPSDFTYFIQKWTNEATFSATYTSKTLFGHLPRFLRIADDGTNRVCSLSQDGQNWFQAHSVGRTDFLTANEVGFAGNTNAGALGITLASWREA